MYLLGMLTKLKSVREPTRGRRLRVRVIAVHAAKSPPSPQVRSANNYRRMRHAEHGSQSRSIASMYVYSPAGIEGLIGFGHEAATALCCPAARCGSFSVTRCVFASAALGLQARQGVGSHR
eukprot:scaffold1860_cov403-Prasinococcus_capsulatus_cf.AAC.1